MKYNRKKIRSIFTVIAIVFTLAGTLLFSGCSEQDIDIMVDIASAVAEDNDPGYQNIGLETETDAAEKETDDPETAASGNVQEQMQPEETDSSALNHSPSGETVSPDNDNETGSRNQNNKQNSASDNNEQKNDPSSAESRVSEDGEYLSAGEVAEYLYLYGHLPGNYLTKNEARELGWKPSKGNLWDVAYGFAIGGDSFGNRERLLPTKKGRKYYECDVNYNGGERGAERLVYSNDGLIFYSEDHYDSFILLYDENGLQNYPD